MIVNDLAILLEGCHTRAEVRLAVAQPGSVPVEMTVVGITTTKALTALPGPPGDMEPGTVWLLSGSVTRAVPTLLWLPRHRRQP